MTEAARVRIARWRPKGRGASVEVIPTRPAPDDSNFIPTLVWVLEQARKGHVVGYAAVFTIEDDAGNRRCIEAAKAWDDSDRHHVLGLIRRMEHSYISRTWDADND